MNLKGRGLGHGQICYSLLALPVCLALSTLSIASLLGLGPKASIASDLETNAIVDAAVLNVRSKKPTLERRRLLVWEWDFGEIIETLTEGKEVRILEKVTVADLHVWARIRYRSKEGELRTGWVYFRRIGHDPVLRETALTSNQVLSYRGEPAKAMFATQASLRLVNIAAAQPAPEPISPELTEMREQARPINLSLPVFFMLFLVIAIFYGTFRFFPIRPDWLKFPTAVVLCAFALFIVGMITFDDVLTVIRFARITESSPP